ncbi:hypothetical protein BDE02_01G029800 [Populus trichocarpa]|nr:hypothetical protein BDE02_01G029800 [Populus trichocarpa]
MCPRKRVGWDGEFGVVGWGENQSRRDIPTAGSWLDRPAVYVAESAISSFLLLLVGKSPSDITTAEYNGPWPSLSYYINKFKPAEIIQAAVPSLTESIHAESSTPDFSKKQIQSAQEVSEIQVQSQYEPEPSTTSVSSVSLAN